MVGVFLVCRPTYLLQRDLAILYRYMQIALGLFVLLHYPHTVCRIVDVHCPGSFLSYSFFASSTETDTRVFLLPPPMSV